MENQIGLAENSPAIHPIGKGCEPCETTGYYCQYRASGQPTGREQCIRAGTRFPGPCDTTWNWVGPCARL